MGASASYVDQHSNELMEEVKGLAGDQLEFLRQTAANDLYVMCKGVLKYKDVNPDTHGGFCRFIENSPKIRRLGLMPRGHLKSTIATIGDSIRLGVKDPNETKLLIAGETSTNAEKFLAEIKGQFEKNRLLRELYPDVVPDKFAGPGITWSSSVASLKRTSTHKEPTYTTVGVGGTVVGSHFTRIKCDDLIGFEAANSPAAMAFAIKWAANIDPLVTNAHKDVIEFIGTRWSKYDLYASIMKFYGSRLGVYTREAIEDGKIIFPALHTWEEYETLMSNAPGVWNAQYRNNPLSEGASDFPAGAVQSFAFSLDGDYVEADGGKIRRRIRDLGIVITVDPNSGSPTAPDEAAIIVSGVSSENEVFVLEDFGGRLTPSGFVDKIYELAKKWNPRVVGIEKAGQQTTKFYFEEKAQKENFYIRVEPLTPKARDKETRIRTAMEPILRSKRLYCLPTQTELRSQIDEFPQNINALIDRLDALAYGTEVWRKPMRMDDQEENVKVLRFVMRSRRNSRTGY